MNTQYRSALRIFTVTAAAGTLASLTIGGNPVPFTTETLKGIPYTVFTAPSGSYVTVYAP